MGLSVIVLLFSDRLEVRGNLPPLETETSWLSAPPTAVVPDIVKYAQGHAVSQRAEIFAARSLEHAFNP